MGVLNPQKGLLRGLLAASALGEMEQMNRKNRRLSHVNDINSSSILCVNGEFSERCKQEGREGAMYKHII